MTRSVLVFLFVVAGISLAAVPASQKQHDEPQREGDLSLFIHLTTRGLTAPLHWQHTDWKTAGGIVLGTGISTVLDDEAYEAVLRNRSAGNDRLERIFEAYSNGLSGLLFSGLFYGSGVLLDNEWLRGTGMIMASALTISAITQTSLKYIAGRARPYTGLGNHRLRPFSFNADFVSFPSGHTIVAFTISTVLARRIDNVLASVALYTAAAMGGFSRIYSGNHWLSDVVFGAALALSVSNSVVQWYEERRSGGMGDCPRGPLIRFAGAELLPAPNGIVLVWRF